MRKDFLVIGIVIIIVVAGGFFGWRYISFASLKSRCLAVIKSEKIEIKAFLLKGTDLSTVQNPSDSISKIAGVLSVEFTSEGEALSEFKERHKDDSSVMQAVELLGDNNPLQPYVSVIVGGSEDLDKLKSEISKKSSEIGFKIESFSHDKPNSAYNAVSSLGFDYPLGDQDKFGLLKSCVLDGSAGVIKFIFQTPKPNGL